MIDLSISPTLRQELVESVDHKFTNTAPDDLAWQSMSATGSPMRSRPPESRRGALNFNDSSDDDEEVQAETSTSLQTYWQDVRERYKSESRDAVSLATTQTDLLPEHWTVVSISVTEDKSTLIVSRRRPRREPLVVYLPLNRQDRREDGGEDQFTWEMAEEELKAIITASDETAKNAKNVVDKEDRRAWWGERTELDQRMKVFVENVEYCWLGVFKVSNCLMLYEGLRSSSCLLFIDCSRTAPSTHHRTPSLFPFQSGDSPTAKRLYACQTG